MNNFKTRLVEEQVQLSERVEKLERFLQSEKSDEINKVQKTLLDVQVYVMRTYLTILNERIRLNDAVASVDVIHSVI